MILAAHPVLAIIWTTAMFLGAAFAVVNIGDAVADLLAIRRRESFFSTAGHGHNPRWWQAVKEVFVNTTVILVIGMFAVAGIISLADPNGHSATAYQVVLYGLFFGGLGIATIPPGTRYLRRKIIEGLPLTDAPKDGKE